MNNSHSQALHVFARKLAFILMARAALQWVTVWLFVWGVITLAFRISGISKTEWLVWGVLGLVPVALVAILREKRRMPEFAKVRASYDEIQSCGGVVMAEEAADMSEWQSTLPSVGLPAMRWRSGRTLVFLALAVAFVSVALLLPERLTKISTHRPLEVGQLVEELQAEVQTLEEEKIVEEDKANELQNQLSKLKEDSSGLDPNKTWEALDHIKESNSDAARQAAEEALSKLTSLTQAEALASALQKAMESGLAESTATRAANDLAAMLKAAKLEEGLLNGEIPPELLSSLEGLNKEDLEKLMKALQFNKDKLGKTVGRLANLRLINAEMLGKCKNAGQCPNPNALAAFLCEHGGECNSFFQLAASYGRGGVDRGRGDAPMTWTDGSDENGAKFKEEVLPPSTQLADAQLVGLSRTAPELSDENVAAGHGALNAAESSGGSSHSQVILPMHRQAVQNFFKREEK